jgi:hypothetical protein
VVGRHNAWGSAARGQAGGAIGGLGAGPARSGQRREGPTPGWSGARRGPSVGRGWRGGRRRSKGGQRERRSRRAPEGRARTRQIAWQTRSRRHDDLPAGCLSGQIDGRAGSPQTTRVGRLGPGCDRPQRWWDYAWMTGRFGAVGRGCSAPAGARRLVWRPPTPVTWDDAVWRGDGIVRWRDYGRVTGRLRLSPTPPTPPNADTAQRRHRPTPPPPLNAAQRRQRRSTPPAPLAPPNAADTAQRRRPGPPRAPPRRRTGHRLGADMLGGGTDASSSRIPPEGNKRYGTQR